MGEPRCDASLIAKRTLVKSPPELWSELSEADRLAKHLEAFGEIKITKLDPEHTVAWEGESASGTVSIEPSGWGTKVTLEAQARPRSPNPSPSRSPSPSPSPRVEPEPERARSRGGRTRDQAGVLRPALRPCRQGQPRRSRRSRSPSQSPSRSPGAEPGARAVPPEPRAQAVLEDALEALGSAHHRPFSRG